MNLLGKRSLYPGATFILVLLVCVFSSDLNKPEVQQRKLQEVRSGDLEVWTVYSQTGKLHLGSDRTLRLVMPFVIRQWANVTQHLSWWRRGDIPPCIRNNEMPVSIDIQFALDLVGSETTVENVMNLINNHQIDGQMKNLLYHHPGIQNCVNKVSLSIFMGGMEMYQAGAYATAKHFVLQSGSLGYPVMALIEADAYPIQPGWMNIMYTKAFLEGPFLIKGTPFNNKIKERKWFFVTGHINGNSLWGVSNHTLLLETFSLLEGCAAAIGHEVGYDVLIHLVFVKSEISQCSHSWYREYCEFSVGYVQPDKYYLKDLWRAGYVETPYIYNTLNIKRPFCLKMEKWPLKLLHKWFHDNIYVHCTFYKF